MSRLGGNWRVVVLRGILRGGKLAWGRVPNERPTVKFELLLDFERSLGVVSGDVVERSRFNPNEPKMLFHCVLQFGYSPTAG